MRKKITVAIPVYNGEKYILAALQSVAQQTIKVDHLLICDNQSNDNSLNIVKRFAKENPNMNFKIHINSINIGLLPNFNKCFELCDTDYLLILSIDDRLIFNALEKLVSFHEKNPDLAVVAGNVKNINKDEEIISSTRTKKTVLFKKGQFFELFKETNLWIQPSAALFNMIHIRKIGFWDTTYIGGDERYWAKILKYFQLAIIGDTVTKQMVRKDQSGTTETLIYTNKIMHFKSNIKIADYETDTDRRKEMKKALKKWAAKQCIAIGRKVWKYYGKYRLAIKYWIYGIKQSPKILTNYTFWKTVIRSLLFR